MLTLVIISALFNTGLLIIAEKYQLWQRIDICPCFFCLMFWFSLFEVCGVMAYEGFAGNYLVFLIKAFVIALSSASLGVYFGRELY